MANTGTGTIQPYLLPVASENNFAQWLRGALGERPNNFLVKNSGAKPNGRPVIDDSRVSKWLKGDQRPSIELASLAARILGQSEADALTAAGHVYGQSLRRIEEVRQSHPTVDVGGNGQDDESSLLYRRPDGLSDQQWESVKASHGEHWEWLIDRAAKER